MMKDLTPLPALMDYLLPAYEEYGVKRDKFVTMKDPTNSLE